MRRCQSPPGCAARQSAGVLSSGHGAALRVCFSSAHPSRAQFGMLSLFIKERLYLGEAQDFVRQEVAAWGPVIQAAGITPD